jgi:hypothetical protein
MGALGLTAMLPPGEMPPMSPIGGSEAEAVSYRDRMGRQKS